jgi:3-methyladenine DNA glycosylase AlkD
MTRRSISVQAVRKNALGLQGNARDSFQDVSARPSKHGKLISCFTQATAWKALLVSHDFRFCNAALLARNLLRMLGWPASISNQMNVEEVTARIEARICELPLRDTQNIRRTRREFSKEISSADPRDVIKLGLKLINRGDFILRFVAYELVCNHREARGSLTAKTLERLGSGINSWESVDTFALYLAGPAWRERKVPDSLIKRWARSPNRWWRRAALVATVPLNSKARGGSGDTPRTLMICQLLVADYDDMVEKALSWALRELAKRDPGSTREFLSRNHDVLGARVLREVRNKLTTGLKTPRGK